MDFVIVKTVYGKGRAFLPLRRWNAVKASFVISKPDDISQNTESSEYIKMESETLLNIIVTTYYLRAFPIQGYLLVQMGRRSILQSIKYKTNELDDIKAFFERC